MSFAENVRMLRISAGMSQKELAEKIGMKLQAYNHYEKGKAEPRVKRLSDIAMALNTDVNTLIGFKNENAKESATRMQIRLLDALIEAISAKRDELKNEI